LPGSKDFDAQLSELIRGEVWREKTEVERELRSAWEGFFKSTVKSAVAGAVTLGIAPFLSLGQISVASVLAAVVAATPWATSELLKIFDTRRQMEQHGLYYLMHFSS